MIRNLLSIVIVAVIALAGGAWLTNAALVGLASFGSISTGLWTANPLEGTPQSDPYGKARLARDASLALGAAEGVTFYAREDESGKTLSGSCDYVLTGTSPAARFWTLVPLDNAKRATIKISDGLPASLASRNLAFKSSQKFEIEISAYAKPGNWLAVPKDQPYFLALNLYDSPMATNKGLIVTDMPTIKRVRCHG